MIRLGVFVLALAACTTAAGSGLRGHVLAGPTCPVERADSPCPDRPIRISLEIVDERGAFIVRFTTGDDGRFSQALPPGRYTVRSVGPPLPALAPTAFSVSDGRTTELTLRADTGIR